MGITNFIVTVAAVGAIIVLTRTDVKQSGAILRRNVKHIRTWLEEESSSTASKSAGKAKPKELDSDIPKKDGTKGESN